MAKSLHIHNNSSIPEKNLEIEQVEYHRNGICGNGFHIIFFTEKTARNKNKVAIVFEEEGSVAVFDRDLLGQGDIEKGSNSWRGDMYEQALRMAIQRDAINKIKFLD